MGHEIRHKDPFGVCASIQCTEVRLSNKSFNPTRTKASGYEIVSLLGIDTR